MIAEKLERLGVREKAGLLVAVVLILAVMVDRLAVHFVTQQISETEAEIGKKTDELRSNLGILRTEGMVSSKYEQIRPRLGPEVSPSEAIDSLKGRVDDLARKSGVTINSMKHRKPEVSTRPYSEFSVEIGKYEAPMNNLLTFLHGFRTAPDIWRISKLTMVPNPSTGQVRGSMLITQLATKTKEAPGKTEEAP